MLSVVGLGHSPKPRTGGGGGVRHTYFLIDYLCSLKYLQSWSKRLFGQSRHGEQLCLWCQPCQTLSSPSNFSLKNVEKTRFFVFMQIFIFRITFQGKVLARWTQRVFCRAHRDLQKSLWGGPVRHCLQGQKPSPSVLSSTSTSTFRPEGSSGDPKFLRQKCSPTPN